MVALLGCKQSSPSSEDRLKAPRIEERNNYSAAPRGDNWYCRAVTKYTDERVDRYGYCFATLDECNAMPGPGILTQPGYVATACLEYPVAYCYLDIIPGVKEHKAWDHRCRIDVLICEESRRDARGPTTECFPSARPRTKAH